MPVFSYASRDSAGQKITGVIDRTSKSDVVDYLMGRQLIPVSIQRYEAKSKIFPSINVALKRKKVESNQLIMFCRQMFTLIKAGVPLIQGMQTLATSTESPLLSEVITSMVKRLETGLNLTTALAEHPRIFNHLFVSLVKVGEETGRLDQVFHQLSAYIERDVRTYQAIKAAMRYPSFVLTAMVIAIVVVNTLVIPAFTDLFQRFSIELPLVTKILIFTSNFFQNYGLFLLFFTVVGGIFLVKWLNTAQGKWHWGRFKLHIPIIGDLVYKATLARYVRSFALALASGVPLVQAIAQCTNVVDNAFIAEKIKVIKSGVERGDSLYRTHHRSELFTPLILQMLEVGEKTGEVDRLLTEVADFYDMEVDYDLKTLSARIEPLLILVMAGFVLILALGIFLPMWEMYSINY